MGNDFFDEQAEQSQVKTAIVTKYFMSWARVISGYLKDKKDKRIAYIDLFAGPGVEGVQKRWRGELFAAV